MASKISLLLCCLPLLVDHSFATDGQCSKSLTIESVIQLVQEIEGANPEHSSSKDILNHLLRLMEDTPNPNPVHPNIKPGDVQRLRQMLHHKVAVDKGGAIEQGVLSAGEEAIVIGNVLAHLYPEKKMPEELGFRSLGDLLAYATMKSKVIRSVKDKIGPKGRWNSGCTAIYSIASKGSAVTRAQILGSIDGLILKDRQGNEDVKLSTALRSYYFGRTPVRKGRADIFYKKETVWSLRADIIRGCEKMTKASSLGTNGLPVRFATIKNCDEVAEDALQELQIFLDLKNACSKEPKLATMAQEKNVLERHPTEGQSHNERVGGGSIKSPGCKPLASRGDCSFYQCVEDEYRDCGDEGLALGYALPSCSRFDQFQDEFTPQGQEWIRASRTCLMTGILPHYKTVHLHHKCQTGACSSLMETFLQLMPECYLDTEPGLCEVLQDETNWQALMRVFEVDGFDEGHFVFMFQQVEDAMQSCLCHNKDAWLAIKEHMKDKPNYLLQFLQTRDVEAQSEISEVCKGYASAGDCRFYECMEERFPCKVKFYSSHFADFELPSCTEFVRNSELLADDGQAWLNTSHSCLMKALLPLYNSDSINCAELHSRMFDLRIDCFVNSQFCGIMLDNDWALHESTLTNGFPKYIPNFARPLTFGYDLDRLAFYYRNLLAFQRLLRDINCECFNRGLSANKYWFSTVYSTQCDCMLRIKN